MHKKLAIAISLLFFCGCSVPNRTVTLINQFDKKEVEFIKTKGNNSLTGNAFLRKLNGEVVTCAGSNVVLLPVTKYSSERIATYYGNTKQGFYPASNGSISFVPNPPEFKDFVLEGQCNSDGRFEFKDIPDGEYFVLTQVSWLINQRGNELQGGGLMKKVHITGGNEIKIIMSQQ